MKFSNLVATASIVGAAVAAPSGHEHKEKRDVLTTTIKAQTTVLVDAVNQANVLAVPADVQTEAAAAPAATPATQAQAAETTQAASTQKASSGSSGSSAPAVDVSASASGVKGVTYSPYNADGTCKSADQVASDLSSMTEFPTIRLYGVDCDQVASVMKAKQANQKVFLGVYFMDQIEQSISTMKSAVEQYGSWNDVVTVSIGNELVNGGQATPSQIGQYVSTGRSALQAAGYSGPVVSVDTFIAVINNPELCQYSDYMAVNAHAYFDQNTEASDSGKWLLQQIQRVWTACGGNKDVVIAESGWPSKGQTYGIAVPSKENQQSAVSSIKSACGASTFLYNAYNDYWKADGNLGVEKYWGILSNE
ncbi:putative family 17 glucosidase KNAG_0K00200 [Huiozyma naganishii CBS 8797]|uniref:Glycoside hydrolase family 17 protein n=1 Tax=Huiozyma naganishii (strain ATCC MYA-139 / BCRC 22969 / CBS 8797 / KCTC 17520 / NBRC 10181 / NCYC 3082 / Yp74L-3) TaxID=1071383 RepID=J7RRA9_HUIN7|nr:hypothetical protein KNAG_0K00200 [Kazachstania naganishii CBS 8797]CCK72388.1 hypothetical protein KNAG_0K00200 [Kazachstania naganishii CBS 8797]